MVEQGGVNDPSQGQAESGISGQSSLNATRRVADRMSGVLLHITSLPSYGGVGDFGPAAYAFVDFLAEGKQRLWQVLPLSPTGYGSSPYSALSAFAGNPLLISLERLVDAGWIATERISGLPGHDGAADFEAANRMKLPLIEEAAGNFLDALTAQSTDDPAKAAAVAVAAGSGTTADSVRAVASLRMRFQEFCTENSYWLTDYAAFTVLRRVHGDASWHEWPTDQAHRKPDAMTAVLTEYSRELAVEQAIQFFFAAQWADLRRYACAKDIRILGDVAIFVNYDSADVWTHPEIFELDEDRRPLRVSGVPPDYFSSNGQRWGNPLYKWELLEQRGFDWWVSRSRRSLALYDMIRLDHFRGFEAFWSIPADEETAINGQWVKAPGQALFQRLREVFGDLPFVAEDLGLITPEVDELREHFGMPGMRILQFGFSDRGAHIYLPHSFVPNTVVYTGTHDNNTTQGWWRDDLTERERQNVETYLQPIEHDGQIVWAMIKAAARSVAKLCIIPMQDVLHIGSEGRMNTPSAAGGNWTWRYPSNALHPDFSSKLAALMEMTDRDGYVPPAKIEPADATAISI